jgi:hypothetical protein
MGDRHHVPRPLDLARRTSPRPASNPSRICPITGGDSAPRQQDRAGHRSQPGQQIRRIVVQGRALRRDHPHLPAMRAASPGGSLSKSSPEPQTDRKSRAAPIVVARVDHRPHPAQRLGIGALLRPIRRRREQNRLDQRQGGDPPGRLDREPQATVAPKLWPTRCTGPSGMQSERVLRRLIVEIAVRSPGGPPRAPPCPARPDGTGPTAAAPGRFHAPPWASVQCRRKTGGAASVPQT